MNIGDNLRHQFVRLSYSPEIMSMEFAREEMITIYDYIKSKEEEIERLKISLSAQEELTMNEYHKKKQLENIIKEVREKINSFDVFKEFTFPLMKREEENQVKSSIDYEWRKSIKEPLLKILDKVGVDKE